MNYDQLLYLDIDFLAEKYEEETGVAPNTIITKNEGMDAQAGISFLKSKLHSQVTKQFSLSNQVMLKSISKTLNAYPDSMPDLTPGFTPINLWVIGNMTIGEWTSDEKSTESNEKLKRIVNKFYEVKTDNVRFSLLPQNEYFLANLQALETISPALQRFISIPVKMLYKALYPLPDIKTFVITPYIIQTNG